MVDDKRTRDFVDEVLKSQREDERRAHRHAKVRQDLAEIAVLAISLFIPGFIILKCMGY